MTDTRISPTDTAICRLLAAGPLPTAALATGLGIPERTARHRLYRLRQAGTVVSGPDGRHRLAAPVPAAPTAGSVHLAASAGDLAAPVPAAPIATGLPALAAPVLVAPIAGPVPPRDRTAADRAAPVRMPDHPDHDGLSPRHVGGRRTAAILAAAVFGLAAAAGIAITVAIHRRAPPAPPPLAPARPLATGFGYPGDPWGGMPW